MRLTQTQRTAFLALALLAPVAGASDKLAGPPQQKLSRINPIVQAVKKANPGVVAIRVPRDGERDMIGAGVIVDEGGLIVTNRHVTGGKRHVKIRLHDGAELDGQVVSTEPDFDLAIIRVKTSQKLTALHLAPSSTDDLMVGEDVFAIGSPYGYDATVSRGIISAVNREITMPNDVVIKGLIQHDAPINPGNSGGPLLNINAEVIGINVAMRDGAQNIAFAINAGMVQDYLSKYTKRVTKVGHGLNVEEKVIAEVGDRQRVVVKHAAHGELKAGDEIQTVGDRKVANAFDIERALWTREPGQQVELKVVRQGRALTVTLTLEANGAGSVAAVSAQTPAPNAPAAASNSVRPANER